MDQYYKGEINMNDRNTEYKEMMEKRVKIKLDDENNKHWLPLTGMPLCDGWLENPEYTKRNKDLISEIVNMKPKDYLMKTATGFGITYLGNISELDMNNVDKLDKLYENNIRLYIPMIEYRKGEMYTQEGRHRSLMAHKRGLKTIPVAIFTEV